MIVPNLIILANISQNKENKCNLKGKICESVKKKKRHINCDTFNKSYQHCGSFTILFSMCITYADL